jgi:hypothetical protein
MGGITPKCRGAKGAEAALPCLKNRVMKVFNPMPSESCEVEPVRGLRAVAEAGPGEVGQDVYGALLQRLAKASDLSQYDGEHRCRRWSRSRHAPSVPLMLTQVPGRRRSAADSAVPRPAFPLQPGRPSPGPAPESEQESVVRAVLAFLVERQIDEGSSPSGYSHRTDGGRRSITGLLGSSEAGLHERLEPIRLTEHPCAS